MAYTKAAIKTHPKDILVWSALYFRCLANGSYPPVKQRIEFQYNNKTGPFSEITPGMLRILHRHMGTNCKIQTNALIEKWKEVGFPKEFLDEILQSGSWRKGEVDWLRFIGSVCYKISENMDDSLMAACYVLSENTLPCCFTFGQFRYIALYLLDRHCETPAEAYLEKVKKIEKISSHQGGLVYMENIKMI